MTMGDYQQVLSNTECWMMLGWPLDRSAFVHRVDELRRIRNDITHFNPDPAPEDTVHKIRHMLNVIRMLGWVDPQACSTAGATCDRLEVRRWFVQTLHFILPAAHCHLVPRRRLAVTTPYGLR